ncbi:MAG: serine/threonine protein kinase [Bdellovibrionales bacterium]|nr:serine/threonine protein kinase [Bdellovibrionales bacterium]
MSETKKFQRFGKYLILDHLVDGGMAKICRARYLGEQANKMVAVKMVQPQFSNDEAFVRMFQDELNITFGMLHPNIMQVYDYGKTAGQLYTAMEYIHGANLKQYLDRLKEKKVVFPVEISCYIVSQVCLGLHYAHTFTDKLTGKPYNIVHRDISPHNIMLTYDGAVKVIDFGIAKANTNSEQTQAGTIKGKLSYLAPEYLDGLDLDARYDEFAVGITLWELLCSRKLFQANNDLAVLKQIQACKIIPPSQINPSVPKELDAIVMKALSKDRAHRYDNLDQMNRALVRFLYSQYPDFNASDLNTFAEDLFNTEIASDRDKFVEYGKIDTAVYIEDMKNEDSKTGKISKKEAGLKVKTSTSEDRKVREIDLGLDSGEKIEIEISGADNKTGTRKVTRGTAQAKVVNGKNTRVGTTISGGKKTEKERTSSRVVSKKQMEADAEESSNRSIIILIIAASFAAFAYFQAETVESMTGINLYTMIHGEAQKEGGRGIATIPVPTRAKAPVEQVGKIVLSGVDVSMEVYVDGQKFDYVGSSLKIPLDKEVVVMVKRAGFLPFSSKVTLTKDNNSSVINVPELERARTGLLTTSMNYTAGSKLIYEESGETIERDLPFKDMQIPEGSYQAKIVNPILGTEKKVDFQIEENKKHFLE